MKKTILYFVIGFLVLATIAVTSSILSNESEEHVCSFEPVSFTATCIKDGSVLKECECGKKVTEEIAALGHNPIDHVCSRCGLSQMILTYDSTVDTYDLKMEYYFEPGVTWADYVSVFSSDEGICYNDYVVFNIDDNKNGIVTGPIGNHVYDDDLIENTTYTFTVNGSFGDEFSYMTGDVTYYDSWNSFLGLSTVTQYRAYTVLSPTCFDIECGDHSWSDRDRKKYNSGDTIIFTEFGNNSYFYLNIN